MNSRHRKTFARKFPIALASAQATMARIASFALFIAMWISNSATAQVTHWFDGAEDGLTYIRDFTSADYPLIQSDSVANGQYAFHLANPGFQDNSFEIDQVFSPTVETNLFFHSRLAAATPEQFARVQASTDNGQTWPYELFTQAGSGAPGESSFSLKQIPLSSFAEQTLRLRFLLDFDAPGSAFTQTDSHVGWFIDDIQLGEQFAKSEYSIGDPSVEETLYLELINRARADPRAEAIRLSQSSDPATESALSFFGIDKSSIVDQYDWAIENGCIASSAQPLAFHESLLRMSELHSQDQLENGFQGHTSSNNPPSPFQPGDSIGDRAVRVGFSVSNSLTENVFTQAVSVEYGHAAFEIDWGNDERPGATCYNPQFQNQGMQNPPGHRLNIHSDLMEVAGIGVERRDDGSHVVTQDFAGSGGERYATGVVYEDTNGNGFYDIGEGRSGVRIDSESSAYFAVSSQSGAYALPIFDDGPTQIIFSEDGVTVESVPVEFQNAQNLKIDLLLSETRLLGDFNQNGQLDASDIDLLAAAIRSGVNDQSYDLNHDQIVNEDDRAAWVHDLKKTYFGDANLDGEFNSGDLIHVFSKGQYEDGVDMNSTWETGDFNGDLEFDSADFIAAFVDGGYEQGPRPTVFVPEIYSPGIVGVVFFLSLYRVRLVTRRAARASDANNKVVGTTGSGTTAICRGPLS